MKNVKNIPFANKNSEPGLKIIECYVDGSCRGNKMAAWAFVALYDGKIIHEANGVLTGEITSMYQVGGEIQAVLEVLKYCKSNNFKCDIYFDLMNLYHWAADIFGGKPWNTNNQWSKEYRETMLSHKKYINKMIKVKSHSGNKYNEYVDNLANKAFEPYGY